MRYLRLIVVAVALLLLAGLVWSYVNGGLIATLFSGSLSAEEKLTALRTFFLGFGWAAPVVYVGFVTLEVVVAPLPGAMLYAPGGIIFGGLWGGLLSTLGNTLGAGIACCLTRIFGERLIQRLEASDRWRNIADRLDRRGLWIVALLRVNPLTSSDMVSYAAGLTKISVWKVMAGTALGMAPLCFAQAYLADELLTSFPQLVYPLLVACGVYVLLVLWVLKSMAAKAGRGQSASCAVASSGAEPNAGLLPLPQATNGESG